MTSLPNKAAVREALRAQLTAALERMRHAARESAAAATHPEAKAEGDKDMRSTETSYVARGQAMRAEDLGEDLLKLESRTWPRYGEDTPIDEGALVEIELDDERRRVFLMLSFAGGTELDVNGTRVFVVSPDAPAGAELVGKREGDDLELTLAGRRVEGSIVAVA
jgi:transcription elongation GreA/GreB family factor